MGMKVEKDLTWSLEQDLTWFKTNYLMSCRLDVSLMVGKVALSLSVGLRWRRVRLDNFHTSLCRWATVHSLLYLSNWLTTTPRQLTKLLDGICKAKQNWVIKLKNWMTFQFFSGELLLTILLCRINF